MSQQIGQWKAYPAAASAEIHPHITLGYYSGTIAAAGNDFVKEGTAVYAASNDWLHSKNPMFNISVYSGHIDGATLDILVSLDGVAVWDLYDSIVLPGLFTHFFTNIYIPGWSVQFQLHNNAAANNLIQATIEGRAY